MDDGRPYPGGVDPPDRLAALCGESRQRRPEDSATVSSLARQRQDCCLVPVWPSPAARVGGVGRAGAVGGLGHLDAVAYVLADSSVGDLARPRGAAGVVRARTR